MRLLADECFPWPVVLRLRDAGHDVVWVRETYPGMRDAQLIELAEREARVILTIDKDLRQIADQRRTPLLNSGVILFRVHPATPARLEPLALAAVQLGEAWLGRLGTVGENGIEMMDRRRLARP